MIQKEDILNVIEKELNIKQQILIKIFRKDILKICEKIRIHIINEMLKF